MKEIFDIETNRDENNIGKIYFYREGNSPWYNAYELSAYYAVNYINNLSDNEKLKASKKRFKLCEDGVMKVGLQMPSFKKYFPDFNLSEIKDNFFAIDFNGSNIALDKYSDVISKWKSEFEFPKTNKRDKEKTAINTIYNRPVSFTEIMKKIIRFDTHDRTEEELREFIGTLRNMCADLI